MKDRQGEEVRDAKAWLESEQRRSIQRARQERRKAIAEARKAVTKGFRAVTDSDAMVRERMNRALLEGDVTDYLLMRELLRKRRLLSRRGWVEHILRTLSRESADALIAAALLMGRGSYKVEGDALRALAAEVRRRDKVVALDLARAIKRQRVKK